MPPIKINATLAPITSLNPCAPSSLPIKAAPAHNGFRTSTVRTIDSAPAPVAAGLLVLAGAVAAVTGVTADAADAAPGGARATEGGARADGEEGGGVPAAPEADG